MDRIGKLAIFLLLLASVVPAFGQTKIKQPIIVKQFKTTLNIESIPWGCNNTCQEIQLTPLYSASETGLYRVSLQVVPHDLDVCATNHITLNVGVAVLDTNNDGQVGGGTDVMSSCYQASTQNGGTIQANAGSVFQWFLSLYSYIPIGTGSTIDVYIVIERLM